MLKNFTKLFEFLRINIKNTKPSKKAKLELLWVLFGQGLAFLGAVVGIKVLTSMMGAEEYGKLALGLTIVGTMNMFVYGPIGQVVLRFYSSCSEKNELPEYLKIITKFIKLSSFFFILTGIFISGLISWLISTEWALIVSMSILFGVVSGLNGTVISFHNAARKRKSVALNQVGVAWVKLGVAVCMILIFGKDSYFILIGFTIGTVIISIYHIFHFRREWYSSNTSKHKEVALTDTKKNSNAFLSYAKSFSAFALFAAISMYSDRWIIQASIGIREVGIYAVIYQIANAPITLLLGVINQFMVPIIFNRAGSMDNRINKIESDRLLFLTVMLTSFLLGIFVFLMYLYGDTIITFISTDEFGGYSNMLWMVSLGLSFFNIAQLMIIKGLNVNRPSIYFKAKGIQAISFFVFSWLLIYEFGMIGIAYALIASSLLYLLIVYKTNRLLG